MLDPNTTALLGQLGLDAAAAESLVATSIALSVVALIAAIPTAMIAKRKGRSRLLWVVFALTIPLLPLLIVWLLPGSKPTPDDRTPGEQPPSS